MNSDNPRISSHSNSASGQPLVHSGGRESSPDDAENVGRARSGKLAPPVSTPQSGALGRWLTPVTLVSVGVILFLSVTAGFVVYIKTDYGRMVLEIHDEQMVTEQDGKHLSLVNTTSGRNYALQLEYFFEVDGGHCEHNEPWPTGTYMLGSESLKLVIIDEYGTEIESNDFTVVRGGKVRVRISKKAKDPS